MAAKKRAKSRIDSDLASRILRTVPVSEAFLFFTDIGQYEGEFAPSLFDFYEKVKTIPLKSIEFHFKRGDFERWTRETLGDVYLTKRISEIKRSTRGEELRANIQGIVKSRLDQLRAAKIVKT